MKRAIEKLHEYVGLVGGKGMPFVAQECLAIVEREAAFPTDEQRALKALVEANERLDGLCWDDHHEERRARATARRVALSDARGLLGGLDIPEHPDTLLLKRYGAVLAKCHAADAGLADDEEAQQLYDDLNDAIRDRAIELHEGKKR